MQCTLFTSDLHLDARQPQVYALWQKFLHDEVVHNNSVEALYILGDFFALWAGDDDLSPFVTDVIATLRALVERGIRVYLLPGNRDFLLGDKFAKASGSVLLRDPTAIDLYGKPILLTHGDILCTHDWIMRGFRAITRHAWFKNLFFALPLWLRQKIATLVRNISSKARRRAKGNGADKKSSKKKLAVDEDKVQQLLRQYHTERLIHGHVHCTDDFPSRLVLDEWLPQQGSVLFYYADGSYELKIVSPAS